MKRIILFIFTIILTSFTQIAFAEEIFNHSISAVKAASIMPAFENASCKFEQTKFLKASSTALKSGGNFNFIKDKGVIFETTYPIQSTTSYTSEQNKRISSIIKSIINKNYTYLEKNFDLYYQPGSETTWILALKPKTTGQLKGELCSIIIYGMTNNQVGTITKMIIDTSNTKTTISFRSCR